MVSKSRRWPPRYLFFLTFQHQTAVIYRASSRSPCLPSICLKKILLITPLVIVNIFVFLANYMPLLCEHSRTQEFFNILLVFIFSSYVNNIFCKLSNLFYFNFDYVSSLSLSFGLLANDLYSFK